MMVSRGVLVLDEPGSWNFYTGCLLTGTASWGLGFTVSASLATIGMKSLVHFGQNSLA